MPIKKSAMKALRQSQKRAERNKVVKDSIEYLRRMTRKAIDVGDLKKAEALAKDVIKSVDKAVQKGVMKKNTAARIKSRLAAKLKSLKGDKKKK
ncbi:MAG: 30S ribosomal protein S20 [Patescibacteria group bacterium]|nr:30S ribosomal protein S20 [Patescibacteria group bacterium]